MREIIEPLVQRYLRASSIAPKEVEVAAILMHARQIPQETTLAVLEELDKEGLINRHEGRIWKVKKRSISNWLHKLQHKWLKLSDTRRNEL